MIDDAKPDGTELGVELMTLIREARQQINLLWASIGTTGITPRQDVALAGTSFAIGGVQFQVAYMTSSIAQNLTTITGGMDGQLILLRAGDANVTLKHNVSYMILNGSVDYNMAASDWILLTNYGGDGDTVDGVWIEVSRTAWT